MKEGMDGYLQDLCEKYIKDGKAAIGINYPVTKADMTELYIYIDEPIKDEALFNMWSARTNLGGVSILGHTMGKSFYEAHKDEISKLEEEDSKLWDDQIAIETYVEDYFDRFCRRKGKEEKEEYYSAWERERAQKEKESMASVEKLILQLTGKKSIKEVNLQDLEQIKQGLIDRQEKVKEAFAEKFGTKENQEEKE